MSEAQYNHRIRIREAAEALVDKLKLIHRDSSYEAVWSLFYAHFGNKGYTGPNYKEEFNNLCKELGIQPQ